MRLKHFYNFYSIVVTNTNSVCTVCVYFSQLSGTLTHTTHNKRVKLWTFMCIGRVMSHLFIQTTSSFELNSHHRTSPDTCTTHTTNCV